MIRFLIVLLISFTSLRSQCQHIVEFTKVDKNGAVKTVRTDRPDTLPGYSKPKIEPHGAQSFDQPIFKIKSDSILFEKVDKQIKHLMKIGDDNSTLDSLMDIFRQLRERSMGTRKIYRANIDFLPFDSLVFERDKTMVRALSISDSKMKNLPISVYECSQLEELELVNTFITKLPRKLRHLKNLKAIYIYNNRSIKNLKFRKNTSIEMVVIHGENPANVPTRFAPLKSLRYLDLSYNNLNAFPTGTANNKKLKELILSNNKITLENEAIDLHPTLEKLDLGKNKITRVPASIQQFPQLKLLKFNHNQITAVDPAINRLTKLEQLSFYNNNLKTIPTGVMELRNLKEIDLYYNEIEKVDPNIAQWKHLEILYLAFNKIYSLPQQWDSLKQLKELYLHNNRISSIPPSIGSLSKLHTFRVNNNLLMEIPGSLQQLQQLEYIDLSNNSIRTMPLNTLQFPKLKILSLVANAWETETKTSLIAQTKSLREKGVVVHLNSFDETVE